MKLKLAIAALFLSFVALFLLQNIQTKPIVDTPIAPTPTPTITPTPTPRPLTFAEMNERYGPCVYVPTLMYHHVQSNEVAAEFKNGYLSVSPENFRSQMEVIRNKGYTVIKMPDLVNFFNSGAPLPKKSVLITFDDGYEDNFLNAYPILREFGYPATIFLITGLMENPNYLKWSQISDMNASGLIYFGNHTWSHKYNQTEIQTAQGQLNQRGLNQFGVFAYPFGTVGSNAQTLLPSLQLNTAFSTTPGSTLCQKQRLILPRIRVGNSPNLNL